jgi:hypothetical protein
MIRTLTRRAEILVLSRCATDLAAIGRGVAVGVRGGNVSDSRFNRHARGDRSD